MNKHPLHAQYQFKSAPKRFDTFTPEKPQLPPINQRKRGTAPPMPTQNRNNTTYFGNPEDYRIESVEIGTRII